MAVELASEVIAPGYTDFSVGLVDHSGLHHSERISRVSNIACIVRPLLRISGMLTRRLDAYAARRVIATSCRGDSPKRRVLRFRKALLCYR